MKALCLAGLMTLAACAQAEEEQPLVTVYLSSDPVAPGYVLSGAELVAGKIFAAIGVPIRWREGRPDTVSGRSTRTLSVRVEAEVAPAHSRALAYANSEDGGVIIHVFYRQVAAMSCFERVHLVLGYVLAHEIGHVLEGISRHSEAGILKARWSSRDFRAMYRGGLAFAPEDVAFLRHYATMAAAERDLASLN